MVTLLRQENVNTIMFVVSFFFLQIHIQGILKPHEKKNISIKEMKQILLFLFSIFIV